MKKKKLKRWLVGIGLSLQLLFSNYEKAEAKDITINKEINIETLETMFDEYIQSLSSIEKIEIELNDENFKYLRYCTNLKEVTIDCNIEDLSKLKALTLLPNLQSIHLKTSINNTLTKENAEFLKECKNLTSLSITSFHIEEGTIETLTQLKYLSIENALRALRANHVRIDYKKLTFLDELHFEIFYPYDLVVYFTSDDYLTLLRNGVNITGGTEENIKTFLEMDDYINNIIKKININGQDTDKEKLKKVLEYIKENYIYDEKVKTMSKEEVSETYYSQGFLYCLPSSDQIICGNFSALLFAILYRVGIEDYMVLNDEHAWNLTKVGDYYYCIDSTIPKKDKQDYDEYYYLPSIYFENNIPTNIPSFVDYQKEENVYEELNLEDYKQNEISMAQIKEIKTCQTIVKTFFGLDFLVGMVIILDGVHQIIELKRESRRKSKKLTCKKA